LTHGSFKIGGGGGNAPEAHKSIFTVLYAKSPLAWLASGLRVFSIGGSGGNAPKAHKWNGTLPASGGPRLIFQLIQPRPPLT
jgi:hypothetical protein